MSLSWTNEETFRFIELYQSESVIWDSNHPLHKDKNKVSDAWSRIADILEIPVTELKKKKESLMSAFRMHFKKKQDSIRSGDEEIYTPIWVFYDAMEAFLKEKYEINGIKSTGRRSTTSLLDQDTSIEYQSEQEIETKIKKNKFAIQRSSVKPDLEKAEKNMSKAFHMLNRVMLKREQASKVEDDCELYGRLLASKLRRYSENERLEIMYEIDGLLLSRRRSCSPQIAEVYLEQPEEYPTTITFDSEDAVNKALDEDDSKTPASPEDYNDGASYIEFDVPDEVERAMLLTEDIKIDRKKILAKYDIRNKSKKMKLNKKNERSASDNHSSD